MPTVQTNDVETYYERHGDGPPLVLVHGAGLDHRMWEPQVEALSEDYEVITYDIRGHGETPLGDPPQVTVELLVEDFRTVIDSLDLEDPAVCGLSLGGVIAYQYAARNPNRVGSLVVASAPTAETLTLNERVRGLLITEPVLRVGNALGPERAESLLDVVTAGLERLFGDEEHGHDDALREISDDACGVEVQLDVIEATYRTQFSVDHSSITAPTLVLYGGNEPNWITAHAGALAGAIPDASIRELPDTGHVSNWDSPALFNDAVRAFLDRTS